MPQGLPRVPRVEVIASTFRNDVSHEVGVDPLDDSRVYISDLKQVVR